MKHWEDLTQQQQTAAVNARLSRLLYEICQGDLYEPALGERVHAAAEKAEAMQTPWFMHEYVMDTCREDLTQMARLDCEQALYAEAHELVFSEPLQ